MTFNYEEGSGFSAFALFNALRLHFTSDSYHFFKYHGKTNVSKSLFETNKSKFSFYKLSRKYNLHDLQQFYIANLIEKDVTWIGEITNQDGEDTYRKWQTRNQKLTYQFEQDIIYLFDKYEPKDIISVVDDHYPRLLEELMHDNIMIETVAIMNDLMGFLPMWKKKIKDDIIWPTWYRKLDKYAPFIEYDKAKFKAIVKEAINANQ